MWFVPQYITSAMPGAGGHWNAWNARIAWKGEGAKTDKPQDMLRQPPHTEPCVSSSHDFSECPLGQNQSHTGHDWSRTTCFDRQPPLSCPLLPSIDSLLNISGRWIICKLQGGGHRGAYMYKVVSCEILLWKCMFDVGTPVYHLTDVFAQVGRERLATHTWVKHVTLPCNSS